MSLRLTFLHHNLFKILIKGMITTLDEGLDMKGYVIADINAFQSIDVLLLIECERTVP